MEDEKIIKLRRALESATPAKPKTTRKAASSQTIEGDQNIQAGGGKVVRQSIKGNGNVQIGGGVGNMTIRTSKGPKIEITAPVGSLGANPAFRARIEGLLKQINDYRYQRLGKAFKFGALYGDLAKAFDIDPKNWKAIWMLDESIAAEVIPWLEAKLDSTQQGRLEKAARREGYAHTRGHMFRIETDYLEQLGWDDAYAKQQRQLVTGKTSRADMKDVEFRHWVDYLRRKLESLYGESKD